MTVTAPSASDPWILLNEGYSHPAFIIAVGLILLLWTIWAVRPVAKAGGAIRGELEGMKNALVRMGEAGEVAKDYANVDADFRAKPVVGDAWAALDRTLLRPTRPAGLYRQTVPASEFFGIGLLGAAGADLRAARAHANSLVGVGLVLTFLGLVLALKAAGGSLGAAEPGQVQDGMGRLLGTAATKFSFSVVALTLSLFSAEWLRREMRRTESAVAAFLAAVDRRLPPMTPQEIASDTQMLLRGDSESRRDETDRLASAIATRLDAALQRRLGEAVTPLAVAISRMTGTVSDANRKALQDMVDRFHERLEAAVGTQIREATVAMERVGGHVGALAETLAGVREGLAGAGTDAAQDIAQSASDAARRIADAAEATRTALAATGSEWERSSTRAATLLRDGLLEGTSALRSVIEVGGESLAAGAERAGTRLDEGARKIEEQLGRSATDAGREIRGAGAAVQVAVATAGSALAAVSETASLRLVEAADAVGDASDRFATSAADARSAASPLAAALQDWRMATGDAASLVSRAAAMLEGAAARIADTGDARDVLDELRSVAARLEGLMTDATSGSSDSSESTPAAPVPTTVV